MPLLIFPMSHPFTQKASAPATDPPPKLIIRFAAILLMIGGFLYAMARHAPQADLSPFSGREVVILCVTEDAARVLSSGRAGNSVSVESAADLETGEILRDFSGKEIRVISDHGLVRDMHYEVTAAMGKDTARASPGILGGERPYAHLREIRHSEPVRRSTISALLRDGREGLTAYHENHFDADVGGLLSAITTGKRASLSGEIREAFNATGLAHLLSISGTHFGDTTD